MQTQSTRWVLLAALMAGLFLAGLYFGSQQSTPVETAEPTARKQVVEAPDEPQEGAADEPEGDAEFTTTVSSDGRSSYRVKAGKAKDSRAPDAAQNTARLAIDWLNEYQSRDVLESAIVGDVDDTIAVAELVSQCRGQRLDENRVQASLSRIAQHMEKGNPLPQILIPGTGEILQFTHFADYEEITWKRFEECLATDALFDDNLRERLAQQARNGSVTARFLYAMWLPDETRINSEHMIDWITYQGLAWDFTWANIREGEPLGLLAYGRSLEQSGAIYFTPRHYSYGPAFIMAARKCGLENTTLDQKIGNLTSYWTERKMLQRLNQADMLSDEIAEMFCH